ncbi:metal ABC transporter ATP-binding protein [Mycobacterium sherrisii]|uniref:Metal ABC transporter ATP-binding protein n=1 Tax=Mycobacterium sherrisii TaxID=243061 RepID=A0A1E3T7U3_9MYCO|nr:ATP-binding cassette domain-containing protein [Mycobacterium sherrisii]MCV7028985.1 ATP-binding cassette domain-containing protein [Mycobacterium sherrisii]MEC4763154.1 ATP-binding cassette domain-containing protein [Mycobacterium sherrisii]ODR10431.1 metal ABC transporter ATP-binding protein [Mycobacterium sherrisii]ORW75756.1 metal ABC transporter ATP-binding protein [Mycobacterium sherrisii]
MTAVGSEQTVVRMRAASAVVGGKTVWSEVSLELGAGEFVAVLGPNGCGKSTLLKSLIGLTPTRGLVEVLGARPGRRANLIGYLPQRRAFDASVRIRGIDVVSLGLDGARWGTPVPGLARLLAPRRSARRRQRLDYVIDMVGAADYATRPIGRCSGGEQQRLLIAQALIRRPKLLLLDEPLDSLDVPSQAGICALVGDVCRRENVAVVMVAHDVNPILPYLDRVIYLAAGSAMIGTPEEVITADQLSALYGMPIDVLHDRAGHLFVVGQPGAVGPAAATQIAGAPA